MAQWTKTSSFGAFGIDLYNTVWSWSGRSSDGSRVALTFWKDSLNYKTDPISYDDTGWADVPSVVSRPGNRERMENIQWALDKLDGIVHVVVVTAVDIHASPREIADCFPQPKLRMKITSFDPMSGEWRAEAVKA